MHGTNQTYIERFTLGDPYTYTGNQCKNEFYRANSLIAHINIYNRAYPIPYRPFIELRGLLSKITETHHETINSQGKCENTLQKEYVFNDKKELTSLTNINKSIIDKVEFYPSLKKMSKTIKTRIYGSKVSTIQKVYRDDNLQYKKFEKYRISDQMTPETILPLIPNEKYIYHNDNVVQKIRNINSRQEQTKTRIRFDEHSNILNLEAFSQKNKTETLYSTKYNYNNHSNITQLIFNSVKLKNRTFTKEEKYNFLYCNEGRLSEYKYHTFKNDEIRVQLFHDIVGNVISEIHLVNEVIAFKKEFHFEYDVHGNWTQKGIIHYSIKNNKDKINYKNEICRKLEYF